MPATTAPVPPELSTRTMTPDDDVVDESMNDAPTSFEALDELHISSHPVIKHKMTLLRQQSTPSSEFRKLVRDISFLLGVEASRSLELENVEGLKSPLAPFVGTRIAPKIGLSPILRAGIGMTDAFLDLFPDASVFYLGLFREKVSLSPVEYYQRLPSKPEVQEVFLLDPILATGGTAIAAINMLLDWGIPLKKIRLVTILASMPGLQAVLRECPGIGVWCGAVDQELTKDGYIIPGLGDSGDRLFNTV